MVQNKGNQSIILFSYIFYSPIDRIKKERQESDLLV